MSKKKNKKKNQKNINNKKTAKEQKIAAVKETEEIAQVDLFDEVDIEELNKMEGEAPVVRAPEAEVPYDPDFREEDFAASANALSAEDIVMKEEEKTKETKKKKQSKVANAVQTGLLCVFAVIFVVCGYLLYENIKGKIAGDKLYGEAEFDHFLFGDDNEDNHNHPGRLTQLSSDGSMLTLYDRITAGKTPENENANSAYAEKLAAMKASLTALKAKNPDIYGWIYAEGTTIDHPMVRGEDNDYYLDHAYTGEALPIGSIFLDYQTKDVITDNQNTVIYGHNVVAVAGSKSAMFHDVTKFLDAEFFAKNKIYIYTMDGVYVYKPVSIYPTTADNFYYKTSFANEAAFLTFAKQVVSSSKVPSDETFSTGDTMITLSTCTNGAYDGRYAMHAKLVEVIK